MYYLYVLKSRQDNKLYIGTTKNLGGRFRQHNVGLVKSTKWRRPLDLIYMEEYETLTEARKREWILKCTPWGGKELKKFLERPGWRSPKMT